MNTKQRVYDAVAKFSIDRDTYDVTFANTVSQYLFDQHHINCADETSAAGEYLADAIEALNS